MRVFRDDDQGNQFEIQSTDIPTFEVKNMAIPNMKDNITTEAEEREYLINSIKEDILKLAEKRKTKKLLPKIKK